MAFYRIKPGHGKHTTQHPKKKGELVTYKEGEVVEFDVLPKGFKDRFEFVSSGDEVEIAPDDIDDEDEEEGGLKRRRKPFVHKPKHKGGGHWVVEDEEGNTLHDGYLSKKDAKQVAAEYNAESAADEA